MGRGGGGYNPANPAPSMLSSLGTPFTGNSGGGSFPPGSGDSAPSPLDLTEFPSLGRPGGGGVVGGETVNHGAAHVASRPGAYSGLSHGWGGVLLEL